MNIFLYYYSCTKKHPWSDSQLYIWPQMSHMATSGCPINIEGSDILKKGIIVGQSDVSQWLTCVLLLFFLAAQRFVPSQVKQEELEELNKELRQCNLQQFIQQTGVLPAHAHSRTGLQEQLEQLELAHLLQDGYNNRGVESKSTACVCILKKTSWNNRIVDV